MAECGAAELQGEQGGRGEEGAGGGLGCLDYLLFSGSRRSGRDTFHARCGDGEPAGNCCHPHSPNLRGGQRAEGLREQGLPHCVRELCGRHMQGAVVRDQEGSKSGGWSQVSGSPQSQGRGHCGWSSFYHHTSYTQTAHKPPTLYPSLQPLALSSTTPDAAMHVCPHKCPRPQGQFPQPMPHRKEGQAEKTGTPPPGQLKPGGTIKATPPSWGRHTSPPLLPPCITLSSHGGTRAE